VRRPTIDSQRRQPWAEAEAAAVDEAEAAEAVVVEAAADEAEAAEAVVVEAADEAEAAGAVVAEATAEVVVAEAPAAATVPTARDRAACRTNVSTRVMEEAPGAAAA
jgi:hypothetical protein